MIYLSACCTVKNEAAIIREWMAFHRAVGVEKLIIVDNGSTDETAEIVRSFRDPASVDLIAWPGPGTQVDMYNHVLSAYRGRTEWCAFIDADEFLMPAPGEDLRRWLAGCGQIGGLGVFWSLFGSSGHRDYHDGLVVEAFQHRSTDDFLLNRHVKSIVRPAKTPRALSSHVLDVEGEFLDTDGAALHLRPPYGFFPERHASHSGLRVNHYHVRSAAEYRKKLGKGYFGVGGDKLSTESHLDLMFEAHDRNEIFDDTAARFVPLTRFYLERDVSAG